MRSGSRNIGAIGGDVGDRLHALADCATRTISFGERPLAVGQPATQYGKLQISLFGLDRNYCRVQIGNPDGHLPLTRSGSALRKSAALSLSAAATAVTRFGAYAAKLEAGTSGLTGIRNPRDKSVVQHKFGNQKFMKIARAGSRHGRVCQSGTLTRKSLALDGQIRLEPRYPRREHRRRHLVVA